MRIDFPTAVELIQNYRNNHWNTLNANCPSLRQQGAGNREDSRSVWFDLNELKNYIDDVNAAGGSGIRFYFGEYSQDIINAAVPVLMQSDPKMAQSITGYGGMQTIVMVPTRQDVNYNNVDFNLATGGQDFGAGHYPILSCANHGSMVPPPFDDLSIDECGASLMAFADL